MEQRVRALSGGWVGSGKEPSPPWLTPRARSDLIGVGMSPHRIGKKIQQKTPKFPQKSLFKITDISSFKFDGARPSWFKIEMQ